MGRCWELGTGYTGYPVMETDVHRAMLNHHLPDFPTFYYPVDSNTNKAMVCFNDNSNFDELHKTDLQKWNGSSWASVDAPTLSFSNPSKAVRCKTWTAIRTNWGTGDYRVKLNVRNLFPPDDLLVFPWGAIATRLQ
jgi:hypothetical protein